MQLDANVIKNFFLEQGINYLYHANTVTTACTFLSNGGLLSRGTVERLGLPQTPQMSDSLDKEYGVWNDIFLDSNDLHEKFKRQNHYGPVLFKFKIGVLDYVDLPPLWITKDNPTRWSFGQTEQDRYFQSFDELVRFYVYGAYREMITLRFTNNKLPFDPYLEEVIVDNPNVKIGEQLLLKEAAKAVLHARDTSEYSYDNVKFSLRKCTNCYCQGNYLKEVGVPNLKKAFFLNT
jgi:hypothetical protein